MKKKFPFVIAVLFLFFQFMGICEAAQYVNSRDQKNRFRYTETDQICAIETYQKGETDCEELVCIERFKWHPDFSTLTERTLEDNLENVLIRQTLSYDAEGRLLEETAWKSEDGPFYTRHFYSSDDEGTKLRETVLEEMGSTPRNLEDSFEQSSLCLESLHTYVLNQGYTDPEFTWTVPVEETSLHDIFIDAVGYCPIPPEVGKHEGENSPEKVKITFINGVLNLKKDVLRSVEKLCKLHGDTTVHYVFKHTEGFTWDFLRSSLVRFGYVTPQAQALADLWKSLIAEMGGVDGEGIIFHYAHSSGGSNTHVARFLLTPEEQKMIKVVTLGSPTVIPNEGFNSVLNYMSISDVILLLDPVSRFKALFRDDCHVIYVGERSGFSLVDHVLEGKSYSEVLQLHGKEFINLYYPG
ncbi:MAG: hypothetical protein H0T62_08435 [Parachlamydiaceae bacterium]|nr:hypothetical protein [Parachlamydiaceae bacterium]